MADRVFLHVGLPKTGTTYLQSLMWDHRPELLRQGLLLPGDSSRQHLWASGAVREDPRLERRDPAAPQAWDRLVAEMDRWPGTAVVSHEFFASARAEQAARAAAALGGAEVHVVVTARETLGLVTARWQEYVKNGATTPIEDYPVGDRDTGTTDWDWASLDLADVLRRWGAAAPPERIHVLTLPRPDEPRETLWLRFATLLGLDPSRVETAGSQPNESLGVVEVELLRRVNADLSGFGSAQDRGNWIRGYLAQGKLVPRGGERFWPSPERMRVLVERGRRIAEEVAAGGYDVIGHVEDLRPPDDVPLRRQPGDVTEAEIAAAASEVIAAMMGDVRRLSQRTGRGPTRVQGPASHAGHDPAAGSTRARRVLARLPGVRRARRFAARALGARRARR